MANDFISEKMDSLEAAQQKAEDAAAVIQTRFPGSYVRWIDSTRLCVHAQGGKRIATIHLENIQ